MTGWEAAFIDRVEDNKIVLSKKKLGFMYSRIGIGRSKRLYPGDSMLFRLIPMSVQENLKPIIIAIYFNRDEIKNSKGMVLKRFERDREIFPKKMFSTVRQHTRSNIKKKNTTEWVYFIDNEEEIFKINEDRTIGDRLSKKDIDVIKKSVENPLKDRG